MAITHNPTKTKTITKNWFREINRRWSEFTKQAVDELRGQNKLATNAVEIFEMSPSQIRTYMVFYNNLINELLLDSIEPPNWQAQYQLESYMRGLESARRALISQGADLTPTAAEALGAIELTPAQFTATPSLATGAVSSMAPIHQDALEFLFARSYNKLKGWTDAMAQETNQILVDAVAQGKGIAETVNEMTSRINVSKSRAEVIARTEVIQAYQRSTINETLRSEEELGEELMVTWVSALLVGRTRELHWRWHGDVVTTKEANRRIGVSPWNCLCALIATLPETVTKKRQDKFKEEKEEFKKMEDNDKQLKVNAIMCEL